MSVTGFLSSMADKAQNALGSSPIAQHIPPSLTGAPRPSPGASSAPTDSHKSHALEQIQHQFRQLQQNYSLVLRPSSLDRPDPLSVLSILATLHLYRG